MPFPGSKAILRAMRTIFRWEPGFNNPLLLSKIVNCRNVEANGRVSFNSLDYQFWLPVLESAIWAAEEVGHLKHGCIVQAVSDPSVSLKDCDAFLKRCDKAYLALSSRPKAEFVVMMSMTYSAEPLFKSMADGDVRIVWASKQNTQFMRAARRARAGAKAVRRSHSVSEEPSDICHLLVRVSAHDPHSAHAIAADSTDSVRGMLNLFVNSNLRVNPFGRMARPHAINRLRPGPYRTVHKTDGSLATETVWYEHRWLHESPSVKFEKAGPKKFKAALRGRWAKLQRSPLRNHIRQGLLRYCRALDQHDAEPALLEMWGALENLTGTQREKYDVTVARAARLFIDQLDATQVAHHVRLRRNSTIHGARALGQQEADTILVHAETLVSRALFFCLDEGHRFADHHELFRFLDLSPNGDELKRTLELARFSLKYKNRKAEPKR